MHGPWVWSLVRELRSHMLCSEAKKKKKREREQRAGLELGFYAGSKAGSFSSHKFNYTHFRVIIRVEYIFLLLGISSDLKFCFLPSHIVLSFWQADKLPVDHFDPFELCWVDLGFPDVSAGKESTCNAVGTALGWEDLLEEENSNPLQYSCLKNSMDKGAWRPMVQGIAKSRTQLKQLSTYVASTQQKSGTPVHLYETLVMHSSVLSRTLPWISSWVSLPKLPARSPQIREALWCSLPYSWALERELGGQRAASLVSHPPGFTALCYLCPKVWKHLIPSPTPGNSVPFPGCLWWKGKSSPSYCQIAQKES